jgi:hypothetical protein
MFTGEGNSDPGDSAIVYGFHLLTVKGVLLLDFRQNK